MNLLTKEESKVSQKMVINNKYKENMERIRVNVLKNKEMVDEMKRFKELELENKKMKIIAAGIGNSGQDPLRHRPESERLLSARADAGHPG